MRSCYYKDFFYFGLSLSFVAKLRPRLQDQDGKTETKLRFLIRENNRKKYGYSYELKEESERNISALFCCVETKTQVTCDKNKKTTYGLKFINY